MSEVQTSQCQRADADFTVRAAAFPHYFKTNGADKHPDLMIAFQLFGICLTLVLGLQSEEIREEERRSRAASILQAESLSDAHISRVAATHGRKVCSESGCSCILDIPPRVSVCGCGTAVMRQARVPSGRAGRMRRVFTHAPS